MNKPLSDSSVSLKLRCAAADAALEYANAAAWFGPDSKEAKHEHAILMMLLRDINLCMQADFFDAAA